MIQVPAARGRFCALTHLCALTTLLSSALGSAQAKTFSFPHMLEVSGRISDTQYTFDTTMFMTYSGGRAGCPDNGGASVDLYLYDQSTSLPMLSGAGAAVCNPCTFDLNSTSPHQSILMEDLIDNAGGFGAVSVKLGFAVIVVSGDDQAVSIQSSIVNSHTGPFDLSTAMFNPREYKVTVAKAGSGARAFVIPHILEKSGSTSNTPYTFDTTIFANYAGGIADIPNGGGAELQFYLYDQSGQFMRGLGGGNVCAPCVVSLSDSARKKSLNVDALIMAAGGFDSGVKLGFGVIVVGGDVDAVQLQGFVVNSHTNPFDVSVFGFEPQPIAAEAQTATDDIGRFETSSLMGYPNPFNPRTNVGFTLAREEVVTVRVYDAAGRLVRNLLNEVRPAGEQSVMWDGVDDAGTAVGSGVYHVQLVVASGSLQTKLVLVE